MVCFCHFLTDIIRVFFVYFCVFVFRVASSLILIVIVHLFGMSESCMLPLLLLLLLLLQRSVVLFDLSL